MYFQLHNFLDKAIIRCTLVTSDDEHTPHAHRLVKRIGTADIDDPHNMEASPANDFTAEYVYIFYCLTLQIQLIYLLVYLLVYYMDACFYFRFNSMGIIHTARKNIKEEIVRKMQARTLEERKRSNINATLSLRDDAQVDFNILFCHLENCFLYN